MPTITLKDHSKLLSDALNFELISALKAAETSKKNQDMENFLMAQSYVMGLQKAVQLINSIVTSAGHNVEVTE